MALSNRDHSPNCRVLWDGFESTTWKLASCGWRASIQRDVNRGYWPDQIELFLLHERSGLVLEAVTEQGRLDFLPGELIPFFVRKAFFGKAAHTTVLATQPSRGGHEEIDMLPALTTTPFYESGIFRPWNDKKEELIVRPETVAELMDRIRQLQEPELQQIRERNRLRGMRERPAETIHAHIVSLAA